MAETMKLAVPTMGEGGLQSERSGHFGHCDCFTLIDITDGEIGEVSIIDNPRTRKAAACAPSRCSLTLAQTLSLQPAWACAQ